MNSGRNCKLHLEQRHRLNAYRVWWRFEAGRAGRLDVRVLFSACNGNKDAAKQIATLLCTYIENSVDCSQRDEVQEVLLYLIGCWNEEQKHILPKNCMMDVLGLVVSQPSVSIHEVRVVVKRLMACGMQEARPKKRLPELITDSICNGVRKRRLFASISAGGRHSVDPQCRIHFDGSDSAPSYVVRWCGLEYVANSVRVGLNDFNGDIMAAREVAELMKLYIESIDDCIQKSEVRFLLELAKKRKRTCSQNQCLLLRVKRVDYDKVKNGVKTWEARPMRQWVNGEWRPSSYSLLVTLGRRVMMRSGTCVTFSADIVDVRRYVSVESMVNELGVGLLPEIAEQGDAVVKYNDNNPELNRSKGLVAFRLMLLSANVAESTKDACG